MTDPLPLSAEPVQMQVVCDVDSSLVNCTRHYPRGTNHGFNAILQAGDALNAYVENVVQHAFDEADECQVDSTSTFPRAMLTAELVFITGEWSGGWAGAMQTTETIVRWTLADQSGRVIWSDEYGGVARGGLGLGFTYKGNLRRRHEQSLAGLYEATVDGITGDPVIRMHSYCHELFGLDDDRQVDLAASIMERRSGCLDLPELRQAMLMFAAQEGNLTLCKLLLAEGANLNESWKYLDTSPLGIALANGHAGVATELVEFGADVDFADQHDRSLLYVAALREDQDALEFLAREHATFTPIDTCGRSSQASALAFLSLAEAAAADGNEREAADFNRSAAASFADAADRFDEVALEYGQAKSAASVSGFLSDALKLAATSTVVIGRQYQGRADARRRAEFKALRNSDSHAEYFAQVNAFRQQELASMDSQMRTAALNAELRDLNGPTIAPDSVKDEEDFQALIDHYRGLAERCREAAEDILGEQPR